MTRAKDEGRRHLLASFRDDHAAAEATREVRSRGFDVLDVYGPWPIHGIDRALGLRRSRLTWACALFGLLGLAGALWLQYWTSATDWPVNVGGKPFDSLPAFIPVAFELTVLLAGLGTVFAFLVWGRLFPGKKVRLPDSAVVDDRFVIVVRDWSCAGGREELETVFRHHGADRTWEDFVS